MADQKVTFDLLARDKASRVFQSVGREAGKTSRVLSGFKKLGSTFLTLGKAAAIGLGGGLAIGAVALKGFVAEAEESRKISRLTEAVIKSTGKAAKVSAKDVDKLATALSNKTGVDDELIQSGANLLLTFKEIKNETGEGNRIFDQATVAITDMSVALGQDMKSSAIQLGKALNDPIKGVTALQRVGVSFTEDQKEQIKTLVESGKTMQAQKLILAELQSQFGGAAEAASSPWEKLTVVLGNVRETIGTALLPYVDKASTWLAQRLPGAVETVGSAFREKLIPAFQSFSGFLKDDLFPKLAEFRDWFSAKILPKAKALASFLTDDLIPALVTFYEQTLPAVLVAAEAVNDEIRKLGESFGFTGDKAGNAGPKLEKLAYALGLLAKAGIYNMALNVRFLGHVIRGVTAPGRKLAEVLEYLAEKAIPKFKTAWEGLKSLANPFDNLTLPGAPSLGKLKGLVPGLASGGSVARGGMAVVGERGPELVNLPTGSRVHDAKSSARMGGVHIENVYVTGHDAVEAVRSLPQRLEQAAWKAGWAAV